MIVWGYEIRRAPARCLMHRTEATECGACYQRLQTLHDASVRALSAIRFALPEDAQAMTKWPAAVRGRALQYIHSRATSWTKGA